MHRFFAHLTAGLLLTCALTSEASAEPQLVGPSQVTYYTAGWNSGSVRVKLAADQVNPHGCSYSDGYIVDHLMSGSEVFAAILLTAYTTNQAVQLTIEGCAYERPKIIAVTLQKQP